jgi:hypothetical protein
MKMLKNWLEPHIRNITCIEYKLTFSVLVCELSDATTCYHKNCLSNNFNNDNYYYKTYLRTLRIFKTFHNLNKYFFSSFVNFNFKAALMTSKIIGINNRYFLHSYYIKLFNFHLNHKKLFRDNKIIKTYVQN